MSKAKASTNDVTPIRVLEVTQAIVRNSSRNRDGATHPKSDKSEVVMNEPTAGAVSDTAGMSLLSERLTQTWIENHTPAREEPVKYGERGNATNTGGAKHSEYQRRGKHG